MASANAQTDEAINYARLCHLLVNVGSQALRDTFDAIHPPERLHYMLTSQYAKLHSLKQEKVLNGAQWEKLYPTNPLSVSSQDFDMSTLLVLLTNSCGLVPPSTGWNELPPAPDKSKEAHLARLKHFRNAVYAHTTYAYVKDPEFSHLWKEICNVIVELGGAGYGTAISKLKNDSLHADTVEHYRQLLNQWKQDKVNFKEAFRELEAEKKVEHTMKETLKNWKLGEFLGGGAYGKVYKCFFNSNGFEHPCAVKVVEIKPHSTETRTEVDVFINEISILSTLKHERILTYYGSEEKDNHLHLFMELMERGSLYDYIKKKKCLDEWESRKFTRQILEGVSFLHSENVIHRDIKGSNVLIDLHGNIKLADFGLSKWIEKIGSKSNLFSYVGTPYWMAPEMFWGKGYGRKFDIWGVGCTVVEMLTGRPPLGHLEEPAAIFKIGSEPTTPTLPEDVSQDGRDFIKATLTWFVSILTDQNGITQELANGS